MSKKQWIMKREFGAPSFIVLNQGDGTTIEFAIYFAGLRTDSEAKTYADHILSCLNRENAPESKETANRGNSQRDWTHDAADEIRDWLPGGAFVEWDGTTEEIISIIKKHVPPNATAFAYDTAIAEHKATIATLSQQLADKKEIIRRLTT